MHRSPIVFALAAVGSLASTQSWELVSPWGVQQAGNRWIAGRTQDVIEINPNQVLVATDGSGVWWLQRNLGVSLSREWDSTNISALATNPVGGYFAGGFQGNAPMFGALYQTKPFDRAPLLAPWEKVALPGGTRTINRILTISNPARIVLATDAGVCWSDIPTAVGSVKTKSSKDAAPTAFSWNQAEGSNAGGFWDVAESADGIVVSSHNLGAGQGSPIRLGRWETVAGNRRLVLSDTSMTGTNPASVTTTSIAVAPSDRRIMYALCCTTGGGQLSINSSEDGGRNWRMRRGRIGTSGSLFITSPTEVGVNGNGRANTITVSPTDPNTIAFGTTHAYISRDGGDTLSNPTYTHDDHARLLFAGGRLYDCCDGGVMYSDDLGQTFKHEFNQKLANLQFYGQGFDAFGLGSNAMGGGLQDINVAVVFWGAGGPGPWQFALPPDYDGGVATFLPGGVAFCDGGGVYKWSPHTGGELGTPVTVAHPRAPRSFLDANGNLPLSRPRVYKVSRPARTGSRGEPITAISYVENGDAAADHPCQVFGLFKAPGRTPYWEPLVNFTVPGGDAVSALGSYNGNQIFVGFAKNAQMWRINVSDGQKTVQTGLPTDDGYLITEIAAPGPNDAYAIRNRFGVQGSPGAIYYISSGDNWTRAAGLPDVTLGGLAAASPQLVFVGTDTAIYKMENNRSVWQDISAGLPKAPHPTTMHVVTSADNRRYLYLATYGWSVWRMPI